MITTQIGMHNRSEVVAVQGMPCVIPQSNSIEMKGVATQIKQNLVKSFCFCPLFLFEPLLHLKLLSSSLDNLVITKHFLCLTFQVTSKHIVTIFNYICTVCSVVTDSLTCADTQRAPVIPFLKYLTELLQYYCVIRSVSLVEALSYTRT
jgi:hypothetical protein